MLISIDAVMLEYVGRMIGDFCRTLPGFDELTSKDEAARDKAFMAFLQSAVASGAAKHAFNPIVQVDEFRATQLLIMHWGWRFPGAVLDIAKPNEMFSLSIKGKRSRYFRKGWELPDPGNPPPVWPN